VPKAIKESARRCLRHYPSEYDMQIAAIGAPEVFQKQMEEVTRMFRAYEEKKNEQA